MRNFRKYDIWQLGHELTLNTYRITKSFPAEEIYGITGQMRRAAYSVPANIAEGCGRESDAEFKRFITISQGSASELEYFSILAHDLGYLNKQLFVEFNDKANKTKRSINNLINKL